jgi:hypothetical protein
MPTLPASMLHASAGIIVGIVLHHLGRASSSIPTSCASNLPQASVLPTRVMKHPKVTDKGKPNTSYKTPQCHRL